MTKFDAQIWTDGSQDKEGYGGCAAIITVPSGKQLVLTSGALAPTTNQRMELLAPIIALNRLWWRSDPFHAAKTRSDKRVVIISDSAYLTNCFKQNWIVTWRRNDWITSKGAEVKNRVLWETLENLVVQYQEVKFVHVHGHNGDAMNELADVTAVDARVAYSIRGKRLIPGSKEYEAERERERIVTKEWHSRTAVTERRPGRKRGKR